MADICVTFASEDEAVVEQLVLLLRRNWVVWWAGDIAQGDWEKEIRGQISSTNAVIPVFSKNSISKNIFRDELRLAVKQEKLIYPFFIDNVEPPLGFGYLNRTDAFGWGGDVNHPGYKQLIQKLIAMLGERGHKEKKLERILTLKLKNKSLRLPCFIFSLSSHETQVSPEDGVKLFQSLKPAASLISAYDAWKYKKDIKKGKEFLDSVYELRKSSGILVLDSGNYEAFRKKDHYSKTNVNGWKNDSFREIAGLISPDLAFNYDYINLKGNTDQVEDQLICNFRQDEKSIHPLNFPLCPIIHLPENYNETLAECASDLVSKVASELNPLMVAIPERELGDGLVERVRTVRDIRKALNNLGKYYPLHLLGTGNPISMIAFAAAGADSFDGLEWCRTVADYNSGNLFHFQHFDFFSDHYLSRLQSHEIRSIIKNPQASYVARVASYNLDFFNDWTKTMQDMIAAGQVEHLLKNIPNIGKVVFKELMKHEKYD